MAGRAGKQYHITEDTIEDWWYSDQLNEIRREFVTGEHNIINKACHLCKKDEANGVESDRQWHNRMFKQYLDDSLDKSIQHFIDTGEYKIHGRQLTLKLTIFGNHCNLSCYTCLPHFSTRRIKDLNDIGWYDEFEKGVHADHDVDVIYPQIEKLLPYTAGIVITGGEPLLMKKHYRFLDMIIDAGEAENIHLSYTTNLQLLKLDKHNFLDYIDRFKEVHINVSIDGVGKRNDYIRDGSEWNQLMKNYKAIEGKVTRQVYYTTSILSVFQCMEAIEFFEDIRFDQSVVTEPDFLSIKHLPEDVKEKLRKKFTDPRLKKVVAELNKDRDELKFHMALAYIKDLDKIRKIKSYELFDELEHLLR